jgi:hypothetical protein
LPRARRIRLFHELLEVRYGSLHGFGRLQHLGHNQLIVIEQPPHFGHARHQRAIDDFERRCAFGALAVEIRDEAVLGAFDDVVGQALVERQVLGADFDARAGLAEMFGDRRDVELVDGGTLLQALLPPVFGRKLQILGAVRRRRVEQQALRQPPLILRNRRETFQFLGVDNGQIQPGLGAVIKEDRVHHLARGGGQSRMRHWRSPALS